MTDSEKERYRLQSMSQYFANKPELFERGNAYSEEVENLRKLIARGKQVVGAVKETESAGKDEEVKEGEEIIMLDWKKEAQKLRQILNDQDKSIQKGTNELIQKRSI